MKLYYSRGACSFSPHIVAEEVGIPLELISVDLQTKKTADGKDFTSISEKGYVPALELDDGRILTEGPAIVQYLADLKPEKNLLPKAGSFERAKVQEWLNYIGTELHKNFGSLFNPNSTDKEKENAKNTLTKRFALVDKELTKHEFIAGDHFTVADAYLFTVLQWCGYVKLDLSAFSAIAAYHKKIATRDSIKKALANEK